MEIQINRQGAFCYVLIDNFFDEEEHTLIKKEILDLFRFADGPETTVSGTDENGKSKKNGRGIFLDGLYSRNREKSDILSKTNKLFNPEFCKILCQHDASFYHLQKANLDTTLINYYSNGGCYGPHYDNSILTAVWFDIIGDVKGGEFYFPDYGVCIELKQNRLVLFHGCIKHEALPVIADKNSFRVSISKFILYK